MSVHHFLFWLKYSKSTLKTKKNGLTEKWQRESVFAQFPQCATATVEIKKKNFHWKKNFVKSTAY